MVRKWVKVLLVPSDLWDKGLFLNTVLSDAILPDFTGRKTGPCPMFHIEGLASAPFRKKLRKKV